MRVSNMFHLNALCDRYFAHFHRHIFTMNKNNCCTQCDDTYALYRKKKQNEKYL